MSLFGINPCSSEHTQSFLADTVAPASVIALLVRLRGLCGRDINPSFESMPLFSSINPPLNGLLSLRHPSYPLQPQRTVGAHRRDVQHELRRLVAWRRWNIPHQVKISYDFPWSITSRTKTPSTDRQLTRSASRARMGSLDEARETLR